MNPHTEFLVLVLKSLNLEHCDILYGNLKACPEWRVNSQRFPRTGTQNLGIAVLLTQGLSFKPSVFTCAPGSLSSYSLVHKVMTVRPRAIFPEPMKANPRLRNIAITRVHKLTTVWKGTVYMTLSLSSWILPKDKLFHIGWEDSVNCRWHTLTFFFLLYRLWVNGREWRRRRWGVDMSFLP